MPHSPDPGLYGSSFADVYDEWYPGGDEPQLIAALTRHLRTGARVLELGVGTGRLAVPLAAAGFDVVGLDASAKMLHALSEKDPRNTVTRVLADAGDPASWVAAGVEGSFDCVLAACNLFLNLGSARAQRACVSAAASRLTPGGVLEVELQQVATACADGCDRVSYAMSRASGAAPVVISTEVDPRTGAIEGSHIELRDDGSSRVRPWSVHPLALEVLDQWCSESGLELLERHADWSGTPWRSTSADSVSTYRRAC